MNANERRRIQKAFNVLNLLCAEVSPVMPLRQVLALLSVALREQAGVGGGGTVNIGDVGQDTTAPSAVVSRDLLGLGRRTRNPKKSGLGLIEATDDDMDLRRKFYKLTKDGKKVIKKLSEVI